jgi:hypothetical protein
LFIDALSGCSRFWSAEWMGVRKERPYTVERVDLNTLSDAASGKTS